MKYGETLRQRSIPEWSHYNVDYDVIKGLIKVHTTPGTGKAVSIPGQGNPVEKDFEKKLYSLLLEENDRVNLFVKSKAGEIERRLNHLDKQLASPDLIDRPLPPSHRQPRRLERYAKLDKEILKTGQEVNSLSRFINAQKLAFRKLLKKYKKWTRSEELVSQFMREVTTVPGSFWNFEVEPLLDQYTAVLHIVRDAFQGGNRSDRATLQVPKGAGLGLSASRFASQIRDVIETNDLVGFDSLFVSPQNGPSGGLATYWVHPDCVIELQVLLLQHSRLCTPPSTLRTPPFSSRATSPTATLKRAGSEVWKEGFSSGSREDDIGVVVLEDLQRFVSPSGDSTSVSDVEEAYRSYTGVAADARWTYTSDAIVTAGAGLDPSHAKGTRLKRKYLRNFFDMETPFNVRSMSFSSMSGLAAASPRPHQQSIDEVRGWLKENGRVRPLSGICAKRSRFAGLVNNASRGVWATLDREIVMTSNMLDDCVENDWNAAARRQGTSFPYAVLQVRHEGLATDSLIHLLDASHLTERVHGFSLEKHAIWECHRPDSGAPPPWLSTLTKDIRKVPDAQKRHSRRSSSVVIQAEPTTSQRTSTTTGSVTDGYTSASTPGLAPSSNTSVFDPADSPPSRRSKGKGKQSLGRSQFKGLNSVGETETSRYWSEYDHPEDSEDEDAYYIYVDPDETIKFPGTDTARYLYLKVKGLFERPPPVDEDSALLRPRLRVRISGDDSDSDSTSDDESPGVPNYGSIRRSTLVSEPPDYPIFSDLGSLLFPSAAPQNHERQQERTKLLLYSTSLTASFVIMVTVLVIRVTGKKKLRPEVDAGMLFGIVANLVFAFAGVGYMLSRQDRLGWLHRGIVFGTFAVVCVVDGMMVASMAT